VAVALAGISIGAAACSEPPAEVNWVTLVAPARQPEEAELGRLVYLSAHSAAPGRRVVMNAEGCDLDLSGGAGSCAGTVCCIAVPEGLFAFVVRQRGGDCVVRADLVERDHELGDVAADGASLTSAFHDRCSGAVVASAVPVVVGFPASDATPETPDATSDATSDAPEAVGAGEVDGDGAEVEP
jgi:hypothetical protein